MYTIEQVMSVVNKDPWAFAILAFLVYGFGFAQYFTSMALVIREKKAPFYFWQHAWYFGHDLTFVTLFGMWFYTIDFWIFKVLWAGCVVFVFIEIFSLYMAVKYERNEIWGKYNTDGKISEKSAWIRGIIGYILGFVLFYTIRLAIGDIMCLGLMMSTNVTVALAPQFLTEERKSRAGGSIILALFIIGGTIFTFSPPGIGMWTTVAPVFNQPWYYTLGIVSLICSIRYLIVLLKFPKKQPVGSKRPIL
ncbi:hypothetical protein CLPUN_36190 [Clostridium puniceum]|uniref:Uncharacterized protein n=1 Tax=Clostridium puniceum TaxID=29367 RepID=A0A1S8TB42_9CLOT|nr:hypothetical protein [Clostridium puniceum]OOM74892.1 hypothetical protein CLPUN_36190 [Clostridium puniceum]